MAGSLWRPENHIHGTAAAVSDQKMESVSPNSGRLNRLATDVIAMIIITDVRNDLTDD